ncbi:hypothetical protein GGS26DRAFT_334151 [Hypomontagnella submonticulosa]|nr:hypothetical protein GGS26DRAFT_334151 [Hypomontagnella submonticulosa]
MKVIKQPTSSPLGVIPNHRNPKDDWEDWEDSDEDIQIASDDKDGLLIDLSDGLTRKSSRFTTNQTILRNSIRHSIQKPVRVKSKARQKAQNAKAGIKLVTDMSKFRRPAPTAQRTKFVDPAALHALEGAPSSASIGSFSWLKQKPAGMSGARARGPSSDLSPGARPIVIGIAVPSDNLSDHQVSPHTAVIETPIDIHRFLPKSNTAVGNPTAPTPQQQRSVWSPDTEASESPYQASRAASSIYSQPSMYGGPAVDTDVPPVPALPPTIAFKEKKQVVVVDLDDDDDDDVGTPCTLFEEDGSPTATRKSAKPKATIVSPESASSPSRGWWDHVTTPFLQQSNPFKQQTQDAGPSSSPQQWNPFTKKIQEAEPSTAAAPKDWWVGAHQNGGPSQPEPSGQQIKNVVVSPPPPSSPPQEWWSGVNEKGGPSVAPGLAISTPAAPQQQYTARSVTSSRSASPARIETRSEKAKILLEENRRPNEEPPPYSPPKSVNHVKYGVILPPSHVVSTERVPSPGPMTPGLPGTMTSQGAINMAEIPLTPHGIRPVQAAVLPDRAPGSYIPGDHFYEIRGPANRTEKQRRRHEKEEAVARKVGGFWRGRGCMPKNGCLGRTGREGRKRRRVWFGVIAGLIAAIILAVVLGVVLTRPRPQEGPPFSIWLNLTDFPPIPTGVMTVAGSENSLARSGCLVATADTAWSCSLPKEAQDSVAPHRPDQPEFIFQIQYDNNTRALWNISNEDQANKKGQKFLTDEGFSPDPAPPTIAEMRFLGNTTDHVQEDDKAGEPTPFFISILTSVNKTVGPTMLSRRQGPNNAIGAEGDEGLNLTDILPPPVLNGDGTVASAQLFPHAVQQPVRLFDRGLPTEHYGFYTYFDKTIFMVDTVKVNPSDSDGGCPRAQAKSLVTFAQTRFLVQIWTRMENNTRLLGSNGPVPWTNGSAASDTPGTMPYPVTVTSDMHGGDKTKKIDYRFGILDNQTPNTTDAQLIISNRAFAGTLVNGMSGNPDPSLGGVDGGTGGCKCEWVNFKGLNTGGAQYDAP